MAAKTNEERYAEEREFVGRLSDERLTEHTRQCKTHRTQCVKRGYPDWRPYDVYIRACEDEIAERRERAA